jgi:hypothetical protein
MEAAAVPLHFTTQNQPLAYALCRVGFKLLAIWNRYTDERLNHLKMPTAEAARNAGKPGNIEYVFERRADLDAALKAWDATGVALKARHDVEADCEAAEAICIVRATLAGQDEFENAWRAFPAIYIRKQGEAEIRDDGRGKVGKLPGFKAVSSNLNEADRERIFPKAYPDIRP